MLDALDRLPLALHRVAPRLDTAGIAQWVEALTAPMRSSGIITPRRLALFVGQCAHESAGFTQIEENLHYSATRLLDVFPSHFTDFFDAASCAGSPERTANRIYANRMGNGDEASGDGWMFRGGGLIQITGRDNYTRLATALGMVLDNVPAWVRMPQGAAASACWFWSHHTLNSLADMWEVTAATRVINGGENGLADRLMLCNRALAVVDA